MALFAMLVEHKNFTRAAKALGIPKSTLSRRLVMMEDQLGVRLLQRTTRALTLTESGSQYYAACRHIVEQARRANSLAMEGQGTPRGLLRVTMPSALGLTLDGLFADFMKSFPEVTLDVILSEQLLDMVEEGIDVALRVQRQLTDSSLIIKRLGPAVQVLVASPAYLQRRGEPTTPEQLSAHDCITMYQHGLWVMEKRERTLELAVPSRLRVNSQYFARGAAVAGLGLALLPAYLCVPLLRTGELRRVLSDWAHRPSSLYLVYPSTRHLPAKVRAFGRFIEERLRANPPWHIPEDLAT